ncbi:hypothetical protein [Nocardia jiangxiensis]|uniref:hypothetical protein n=1 Tax=Nocardia jiangxiensis TaxID=282685 RepID=UPI0005939977|nr:hypothetical protein [Nocardia jiangxiensis]
MKPYVCPRCNKVAVFEVSGYVLDLLPGDIQHGGRTVYGTIMITVDRDGAEAPVILDGTALRDARRDGLQLFRRHGITCERFWPRDGSDVATR